MFGTQAALGRHLSQAEVIFEYRPSNRPGPAAAREEFRMGFFLYFDKLWELINLRNDLLHYQSGPYVLPLPAYNERVVREAILNAVSHRNYQLSGSIFVKHYFNRLEIDSPGSFPHGITRDNIMFRQAPRNRLIAEVLARCGLVERAGQGMDLIYELCIREAKALPNFLDSDEYIVRMRLEGSKLDEKLLAVFRKIGKETSDGFSTEELVIINSLYHWQGIDSGITKHLPRLIEQGIVVQDQTGDYALRPDLVGAKKIGKSDASIKGDDSLNDSLSDSINRNDSLDDSLSDAETAILNLLINNPRLTRKELSDNAMIPVITVQRTVKSLQDKGLIERTGSKKYGYWKVNEMD